MRITEIGPALAVRVAAGGVVALALAVLGSAGRASAQEVTLKVHHLLPPPSTAHAKFIAPWCEKLAQDSGGKLKCEIYPAMQLGGAPTQLYDQAKDGVADVVWTLPGYTAGRFPKVEAFELPFTMTSAEATSRALWEYVQQYDADEFKDVHLLALHTHGPGYLHMRSKPVKSLADLKGLKVRAPTRVTNRLLSVLGATPVGIPVTKLPEALTNGVVDGAVLPWEVVPAVKAQELTAYHTETDPGSPALYTQVFVLAMNKARYESLPPELKKVLDANSGAELSAQAGKIFQDADAPARALAQQHGNQFFTISAADLASWKDAAAAVAREWVEERNAKGDDGAKLLEAARALIAKQAAH